MGKKDINRAVTKKIVSPKQTVTKRRLTASKKKRASADLLQMSKKNQEECSLSELKLFKRLVLQSDVLNRKFKKIYPKWI